jgi:hypothetical protein
MNQYSKQLDKTMTTEQFTQVVEAILAGKYSWACVLILRFAGYNPLHYIPYRTYNRLMKDHEQNNRRQTCCTAKSAQDQLQHQAKDLSYQSYASKIEDLGYFESIEHHAQVKGGSRASFFVSLRSIFRN